MKYFYLLPTLLLLISCSITKKENQAQKVITETKNDTVYIKTFEKLPNSQSVLDKYEVSSEFYPAKGKNQRVKYLILHYTALDNETSARVLCEQEVSAHYLVEDYDNDKIQLLVSENERAWHAGVSHWKGKENLNDTSIGIEIVNLGYTGNAENMQFYDFPNHQIKRVAELCKDIIKRYELEPTNVIGHSDVAPVRKQDPGPKFPWQELYEKYNIGAWYDKTDKNSFEFQLESLDLSSFSSIKEFQEDLNKYGYQITPTGSWDSSNKKVVQAFQMHFRPQNFSGTLDIETWAILKALLKKYPSK